MAGEKTAALMRLTAGLFGARLTRPIDSWTSRSAPFPVGPFTITPILTDHSAPDAYMLLIDGAGRRILYTGDFRLHGRKSALVEAMIARPPTSIDVLIMEGTNLGSDKPVMTERALERAFVKLARATPGHIFVNWSAQNIDRTVTLFRAARRTGRRLVVDLYGADVLQQMGPGTALPVPGEDWADLRVVITPGGLAALRATGATGLARCNGTERFCHVTPGFDWAVRHHHDTRFHAGGLCACGPGLHAARRFCFLQLARLSR